MFAINADGVGDAKDWETVIWKLDWTVSTRHVETRIYKNYDSPC
jgi:hypothetical protein